MAGWLRRTAPSASVGSWMVLSQCWKRVGKLWPPPVSCRLESRRRRAHRRNRGGRTSSFYPVFYWAVGQHRLPSAPTTRSGRRRGRRPGSRPWPMSCAAPARPPDLVRPLRERLGHANQVIGEDRLVHEKRVSCWPAVTRSGDVDLAALCRIERLLARPGATWTLTTPIWPEACA